MIEKTLMAAALCLAAIHAQAGQPAAARADAADSAVPATRYTSPLAAFRGGQEPAQAPSATWLEANAIVAGKGGMQHGAGHDAGHGAHAGHAGHAQHGGQAGQGQQGHADHAQHGQHAGHGQHRGHAGHGQHQGHANHPQHGEKKQ